MKSKLISDMMLLLFLCIYLGCVSRADARQQPRQVSDLMLVQSSNGFGDGSLRVRVDESRRQPIELGAGAFPIQGVRVEALIRRSACGKLRAVVKNDDNAGRHFGRKACAETVIGRDSRAVEQFADVIGFNARGR